MEYLFFWNIENYSCCWHKNGEILTSPEFTTEGLKGTVWTLELYPRGENDEDEGSISLFLTRSEVDNGPANFSLKYKLSMLTEDGSSLCTEKGKCAFETGQGRGSTQFVQMYEVLVRWKSEYLPHDTLRIFCKMWWGKSPTQKIGRSYARTRIAVKKISFLHLVKDFGTLKPNQSSIVEIGSDIKEEGFILSKLYCTDGSCCEEKIIVEIASSTIKFLSKCKLSLLDGLGNLIGCGPVNNRLGVVQNGVVKLALSLTKELIMARRSEFLTDDKLSLLCECTFSTGLEFSRIEETVYEIPKMTSEIISNRKIDGKQPKCSNALDDDFKAMYRSQFFTDIELKTETISISAHKFVLRARSPVFQYMLRNDMQENNCDCIIIEDLEDDILKQLLHFLYCDNLKNLQWETAIKLYYAADAYQVKKLKVVCSQFLEENLTTSTAATLLLLADTLSDSDLKQVVEDFISRHDALVFGSDEWENLIETNPQLAVKTMHLKYKRKN